MAPARNQGSRNGSPNGTRNGARKGRAQPQGEPTLLILPYNQHLLSAVYDVFYRAVHDSCAQDYSPEQLDAWAPPFDRAQGSAFNERLERNYCIVACLSFDAKDDVGGSMQVVGYGSLTAQGHLDHLFVDPQYQRNGIATELCHCLENVGAREQHDQISVDASITALPFFTKMGFGNQVEQQVTVRGQTFTNYHLTKTIEAKQSLAQALAAAMAAASAETK